MNTETETSSRNSEAGSGNVIRTETFPDLKSSLTKDVVSKLRNKGFDVANTVHRVTTAIDDDYWSLVGSDTDDESDGPGLVNSSDDESDDGPRTPGGEYNGDAECQLACDVDVESQLDCDEDAEIEDLQLEEQKKLQKFQTKRRQRRKRSQIIRSRNAKKVCFEEDGEDDNTKAGSLPAGDSGKSICGTQSDLMKLLSSIEEVSELIKSTGEVLPKTCCKWEGAAIAIIEGEKEDAQALAAADTSQEWIDVEFEVALDSGSTDNVCHEGDAPGYLVEPSQGSRRGQQFVVGDGNKISNDGEVKLNLQTLDANPNDIASTFQVAKVSRPLMSVGKICDNDMDVIFSRYKARVVKDQDTVCTFERQDGGLYLARFRLKRPNPLFGRQG